jgi:hypothetical protein
LPNDEDWLFRPVLAGLIKYESLLDGTLGLEDIALLNDALSIKQENEYRINQASIKE